MDEKNPKRAIFLDRDGVINKDKGHVYKIKDFEFEKNALKGLQLINSKKYLIFVISNQAGIAKGYYTKDDFKKFDQWLKKNLMKKGIKITKTYYCPHHPEGKTLRYRKKCFCRKPEIGLLLKAKEEFNINLNKSYLIGDTTGDILCGGKAGCKTILIKTGYGGEDNLFSAKADFVRNDLYQAIKLINKEDQK